MDNFEKAINDIFEIETIDEIIFKTIEINPDKTIYFAFRESQKIMFDRISSVDLKPICFILKMNDQYHYCPLNDEEFDEETVKKFVLEIKKIN